MNLSEQKLTGTNEIHLLDSLNAALLSLKVKRTTSTVVPNTNTLIIYVSKTNNISENAEKKTYSFDLSKQLEYLNEISDEFIVKLNIENNDVVMQTLVERYIDNNTVLTEPIIEEIASIPLTLFEGENYIYTNYTDAYIELTYPKDDDLNKNYLNNNIFYNYKLNNPNDFSLNDIYFKDAFTKTEDNLNLEIDNLNIGCITSKNNKFSLDSEGNLVVNSVTTLLGNNNQSVLDLVYPIGSLYLTVDDKNPTTLFGGTWEQIKDRFLLGAGDNYENGSVGGEATHKHIAENMRAMIGAETGLANTINYVGVDPIDPNNGTSRVGSYSITGSYYTNGRSFSHWTPVVGYTSTDSNMPPYLTVYMWKRIK